MDNDEVFGVFCVGILAGVLLIFLITAAFGTFKAPTVVLCDDISLMSGYETRILDDACELNIDGYWITYDNYMEHLR